MAYYQLNFNIIISIQYHRIDRYYFDTIAGGSG
jgi:hypothetical protein